MNWPKQCADCRAVVFNPADARAHVCRTEAPTEPVVDSNNLHYTPERRDVKCDAGCKRPRVLVIADLDLGFCLKHEDLYEACCEWWSEQQARASV